MLRSPLLFKKEEQSIYHCVEKPAREGFNFLNNFRKKTEKTKLGAIKHVYV